MGAPVGGGLQALMASRIVSELARRGTPGMVTGAGPGGEPGPGAAVAEQMSELRGADPQMIQRYLQDTIQRISALISLTALRVPGVAQSLAAALKALHRAHREAQTAAQVTSAVGTSPLIGLAAAGPAAGSAGTPRLGPGGSPGGGIPGF